MPGNLLVRFAVGDAAAIGVAWDNGGVRIHAAAADREPGLRHVAVVGGSIAEWTDLPPEQWKHRLGELGKVADHAGASWLTLRPYEIDRDLEIEPVPELDAIVVVGSCTVHASPLPDGRSRLLESMRMIVSSGATISEAAIELALNAPARVDPDLVVVLGEPHRLPASLMWELAYSELVFVDVPWSQLQGDHVEAAITSFARRHRRFGGLD